ncbi:methyltransferase domain-containing protein [Phytomonospora sp. NPDC050363]|uniref:methyltransferase domain-containing protein n=1 Tax=Phytomonospora sp. NPDC050363 TaxID=3155642 RepID=UPI0033C12D79
MTAIFEATVPDRVGYLDRAAASESGRAYKPLLLDALEIGPGHTVVDLGCGPGTDLAAMARAARVYGIDHDPSMAGPAAERVRALPDVEVVIGDVHDLPFGTATVDRVRTDRVLQHVAEPSRALAEARRILRPGGRLVMGEPDWETLAVDHPSPEIARAYTRFVAERVVRNAVIGRRLARLAAGAGFEVALVLPVTSIFRDAGAADEILGFRRVTGRAVEAGYLSAAEGRAFLDHLAAGPFFASLTLFVTVAIAAPGAIARGR